MSQSIKSKGFTLIELLVVVGIIGALIGILVPVLAIARKRSNMMIEGTNLSSIVKGLAVYGDGNKGYYGGVTSTGKLSTASFNGQKYAAKANGSATDVGYDVEGTTSYAYAVLMDEDALAPKQLLSTGETGGNSSAVIAIVAEAAPEGSTDKASTTSAATGLVSSVANSSYAVLAYGEKGLRSEWKSTTSQQASVIATRLIFNDGAAAAAGDTYSSVWTDAKAGKFEGSEARNDTSVNRVKFAGETDRKDVLKNFKYGANVYAFSAVSSKDACGLWGKSAGVASNTALPAASYGGTPAATDAAQATGFLGAAND